MWKVARSATVLLTFGAAVGIAACSDATDVSEPALAPQLTISADEYRTIERAIQQDEDAQALMALVRDFATRGAAKGIGRAQVLAAYQAGGNDAVYAQFEMSRIEAALLNAKIQGLHNALLLRYPALAAESAGGLVVTPSGSSADCDVPNMLRDPSSTIAYSAECVCDGGGDGPLNSVQSADGLRLVEEDGCDPNKCKWLPYIGTLALCTQTGPAYLICAYVAMCGWCSGPDFDALCDVF